MKLIVDAHNNPREFANLRGGIGGIYFKALDALLVPSQRANAVERDQFSAQQLHEIKWLTY